MLNLNIKEPSLTVHNSSTNHMLPDYCTRIKQRNASANQALSQPTSKNEPEFICKTSFWQFPIKQIKHVMPELLSCTPQDRLWLHKDMSEYSL